MVGTTVGVGIMVGIIGVGAGILAIV